MVLEVDQLIKSQLRKEIILNNLLDKQRNMEREIEVCTDLLLFSYKDKLFLSAGILFCFLYQAGTDINIKSKWVYLQTDPQKVQLRTQGM